MNRRCALRAVALWLFVAGLCASCASAPSGLTRLEIHAEKVPGTAKSAVMDAETVVDLGISANGRVAVALSEFGELIAWDTRTGRVLGQYDADGDWFESLQISSDGQQVAFVSDGSVFNRWDVRRGEFQSRSFDELMDYEVTLVGRDESGRLGLFLVEGEQFMLWDMALFVSQQSFPMDDDMLGVLGLSRDGSRFYSIADDTHVEVRSTSDGHVLRRLQTHGTAVVRLVEGSAGDLVGVDGDGVLLKWPHGQASPVVLGESFYDPFRMVVSGDGQRLMIVDGDGVLTIVSLDEPDNVVALSLPCPDAMMSNFSPDGRYLLFLSDQKPMLEMWSIDAVLRQAAVRSHGGDVFAMALNASAELVISGGLDGSVKFWSLESSKPLVKVPSDIGEGVRSVAIAPDGGLVAVVMESTAMVLGRDGVQRFLLEGSDAEAMVAFSPDGTVLAVASIDSDVYLLDARDGKPLQKIAVGGDWPQAMVFEPSGQERLRVMTSEGGLVTIDPVAGKILSKLNVGCPSPWPTALSPDGRHAVVHCGRDLVLWDLERETSTVVRTQQSEYSEFVAVTFGAESQTLAVIEMDGFAYHLALDGTVLATRQLAEDGMNIIAGAGPDCFIISEVPGELIFWNTSIQRTVQRFPFAQDSSEFSGSARP